MNEHLEIGLYRLAYYMLQTIPPPDTIEGTERVSADQLRGALMAFIAAIERRHNLPRTFRSKRADVRAERCGAE